MVSMTRMFFHFEVKKSNMFWVFQVYLVNHGGPVGICVWIPRRCFFFQRLTWFWFHTISGFVSLTTFPVRSNWRNDKEVKTFQIKCYFYSTWVEQISYILLLCFKRKSSKLCLSRKEVKKWGDPPFATAERKINAKQKCLLIKGVPSA